MNIIYYLIHIFFIILYLINFQVIEAINPLEDLCINSRIYHSLPKNRNPSFQKKSWDIGCQKNQKTLTECYSTCDVPNGCCGITCASNSCSGGGCCSASKTICKKACDFYFSPKSFEINWINQTRWINKTRWINQTRWINKTRWINAININWINATKWINKTIWINAININWINQTRWINATKWIYKKQIIEQIINKTNLTQKINYNILSISQEKKNINTTKFDIDFNNIYILGGISISGLIVCGFSLYIAWKCWLRDHIEDIILNYCCGDWGERFMDFMEFYGIFESWRDRKEEKEDQIEYYGLTPEEIEICKEAIEINKEKFEEAIKIKWEEIAKHATRPNDDYHNYLLNKIIPSIELTEITVKDNEEKIETD